jgi:hypothetical protein
MKLRACLAWLLPVLAPITRSRWSYKSWLHQLILFSVHFLSRNPKQLCTTVTNIVATVISMRSQSLGEPCQTQAKFQSSSKGHPNGNFTQNSCSREKTTTSWLSLITPFVHKQIWFYNCIKLIFQLNRIYTRERSYLEHRSNLIQLDLSQNIFILYLLVNIRTFSYKIS